MGMLNSTLVLGNRRSLARGTQNLTNSLDLDDSSPNFFWILRSLGNDITHDKLFDSDLVGSSCLSCSGQFTIKTGTYRKFNYYFCFRRDISSDCYFVARRKKKGEKL